MSSQCTGITLLLFYTAHILVYIVLLASKSWASGLVMHAPSCQLSAQPCTCTEHFSLAKGKDLLAICNDQMIMCCCRCESSSSSMTRLVCKCNDMYLFKMQVLPQSWPGIHRKFRWGCNAVCQCVRTLADCIAVSPELQCLCRMFAVGSCSELIIFWHRLHRRWYMIMHAICRISTVK